METLYQKPKVSDKAFIFSLLLKAVPEFSGRLFLFQINFVEGMSSMVSAKKLKLMIHPSVAKIIC
jgi:hypothetical protein